MKNIYLIIFAMLVGWSSNAQKVGIGTTTPQAQLQVAGSVRLDTLKGTSLRPVYTDVNGSLLAKEGGYVFTNNTAYTINAPNCSASSPITVSGFTGPVTSSNIQVKFSLGSIYDYSFFAVYLVSPTGQLLNLYFYQGTSSSPYDAAIFTDNTTRTLGLPPYTGLYKPYGSTSSAGCNTTGTLTTFAGFGGGSINPNGTWSLILVRNTGTALTYGARINNWSINFENSAFTYQGLSANYVTKTDASGLLANSLIYDNGTNVGIGTTTPLASAKLDVAGVIHATAFDNTSDARLKIGVRPTHYGLKDLLSIQVADYRFRDEPNSRLQTGFLAQQLYTIYPTAVTKGNDRDASQPYMVDYSKLTPLLVKAVQELTEEVEELKATIRKIRAQKK